ncbi:MAG: DUF5590 domain-containing protein [Gorillibacterium sp.]|nr:DUF5590 domain-containing protein [Gorillibacterium sp.]
MRLWKKILLGIVILSAITIFFGIRFYNALQKDLWTEEKEAIQIAKQKTELTTASSVDPFVEENSMMIVHGVNKEGRQMFVWVGQDFVHPEFADAGVDKETIRQKTLKSTPHAQIMRIVPGIYDKQYIWQVFYRVEESVGGDLLYYEFYNFYDGALMDKWKLGQQ